MNTANYDEIVFQILVQRMKKKKKYMRQIKTEEVLNLLAQARETFAYEPPLLELEEGLVIVGDLHGNINDLIRIFERLRYPPATRYLFLGDYVDRGEFGTEIVLLLLALKIKFPSSVYLLRGNHESAMLTHTYGFEEECTKKYGKKVYQEMIETFYYLPMCAIVGKKIFCVHGGISPKLQLLKSVKNLKKVKEFPMEHLFTDMVWSDPNLEADSFKMSHRGSGFLFGPTAIDHFMTMNGIDLLVRSHEACNDGIHWPYADDEDYAESCVTIFSSSDYCGRGNDCAVMVISHKLEVSIELFHPITQDELKRTIVMPYWLSNYITQKDAEVKRTLSPRELTKLPENIDLSKDTKDNNRGKLYIPVSSPIPDEVAH